MIESERFMENVKPSIISRFCLVFIDRYRVTILLFLATVILGGLAYTTFLKREGFPEIAVPFGVVRVPYFVGDAAVVDKDITQPIEAVLTDVEEVLEVTSTTTDNFAVFAIRFDSELDSEGGINKVRDQIRQEVALPKDVVPVYQPIQSGQFFGSYDVLVTLTASDATLGNVDLVGKAQIVADEINKLAVVATAEPILLTSTEINPITKKPVTIQTRFNRVGVTEGGGLVFRDALSVGISKKNNDVDIIKLSDSIRETIDIIIADGKLDGYRVVYTVDFAEQVQDQIGSLEENALGGLIAVVLVIYAFISWRASILAAIFIPTVMAGVFFVLYLLGYSLNVITLFSLILVIGIFVDDATVVIEAMDYYRRKGERGVYAIIKAINDIGVSDISGTVTTLLVFVPMIFTAGVLGDFIQLIPITVILAMALSLVVALTFIPFLAKIIIFSAKESGPNRKYFNIRETISSPLAGSIEMLGEKVAQFVGWYLRSWVRFVLVLMITIGLIIGGSFYASKLPFNIFPTPKDVNSLRVELTFDPGTKITEAMQLSKLAEEQLLGFADVIEGVDYLTATNTSASMRVKLIPYSDRSVKAPEIAGNITNELQSITSLNARVVLESAGPPSEEYPFAMQIYGDDFTGLQDAATNIQNFIKSQEVLPGTTVTATTVENTDAIVKKNGQRFLSVRAKYSDTKSQSAANLELKELITNEYTQEKLEEFGLKVESLTFDFGQESENLESFNSAVVAFLVTLILMYALLVTQYNSFTQPILIFLAIPLGFPLLFPGLYLTGNALSFFAALGLIALVGIVVNNTIMLVDYANKATNEGLSARDAIVRAVRIRLRPIVTTTATTVGGLLPLALTDPFWESLSLSIIFGLVSSAALVVTVFPIFYIIVENSRIVVKKVVIRIIK